MKKLFNKKGMTYVELLVALSLLVLIIVSFTPMLLQSYSQLYEAGEESEKTYIGKTQLEEGLAMRKSTNIASLGFNLNNFISGIEVKGRKLTATAQENLETIFHGARARIDIISAKTIYDDKNEHEVILQATNLPFDKVQKGANWAGEPSGRDPANQTIMLYAFIPNKSAGTNKAATDDALVYTTANPAGLEILEYSPTTGKIKVKISGFDFTQSPIKFRVWFYDEKCQKKDMSTYVYVKPATILIGGAKGTYDYYTTPGVEATLDKGSGKTTETFNVYGRSMTVTNSAYASAFGKPSSKGNILNVSWIDNDGTAGLDPYYVLTGSNGIIYRMYNFNATSAANYSEVTKASGGGTGFRQDKVFKLLDGSVVLPAMWSADYTEQFGYSTFFKSMGYRYPSVKDGGTSCWYTQDGVNGETSSQYRVFGHQAKYAYYFNGWRTDYEYSQQNNRKISYVLTEANSPLRICGAMGDKDAFTGYNDLWEADVRYLSTRGMFDDHNTTQKKAIKIYCAASVISDKHFAYLNLKSFNNLGATSDLMYNESKFKSGVGNRPNYLSEANATKTVNITSAVYDEMMGGMFYTGTVDAYVYMQQTDNTSGTKNYSNKVEANYIAANPKNTDGTFTGYYMYGTNNGSTIKTYSEGSSSWGNCTNALKATPGAATTERSKSDLVNFYVNRQTSVAEALLKDVNITFGFSSNRARVYTYVTVNFETGEEQYKSYEKYYFLSHYGTPIATYDANPNAQAHYYSLESGGTGYNSGLRNSYNNDYYNVWFPGEFYNITKTVAKENVVVGVGYSVAGSTFQWVNPSQTTNTSTALGSVYNDGVLAVKSVTEDRFNNKLYFKDNATFDGTSLSNVSQYKSVFGTYGTHSRDSVQFTAVDLLVVSKDDEATSTQRKDYYAIYGDNKGRVFKSRVASTTANTSGSSSLNVIDRIMDTSGTESDAIGYMNEIKVDGSSLSQTFSRISTITVGDGTIVISGVPKTNDGYVVIGTEEMADGMGTGNYTWKRVKITSNAAYKINDAIVLDGYYYACGENGTSGFVLACSLDVLNEATAGANVTSKMPKIATTKDPLYSLDGHSTK